MCTFIMRGHVSVELSHTTDEAPTKTVGGRVEKIQLMAGTKTSTVIYLRRDETLSADVVSTQAILWPVAHSFTRHRGCRVCV